MALRPAPDASRPRATGDGVEVVSALRRAGVAADASPLARSLHASDASLYRVEPLAVATPRHTDDLIAVTEVCRSLGVPITARGAGTSIAGNAVGPGVVVVTRHLDRVLEVDAEAGWAVVEPGLVQASLQREVMPLGWRFGPDPSTHDRATIGGMVGNNACGSRALGYGRTSDNVLGLDVVTGAGERLVLGDLPGGATAVERSSALQAVRDLVGDHLALVRTEHGRFTRQVSGYSLEHVLPERGFDTARMLVGSEGTLATTLRAKVRLVRDAPHRLLVALGYPTMPEAADAVPAVLPHGPVACEGLDARIVDVIRARRGPAAVPPLPRGAGWLFVELVGDDEAELASGAARLVADAGALDAMTVPDVTASAALWKIREDGSGLSSRTPRGNPAHAGWEDAAVPPDRLGAYLRDFDDLLAEWDVTGLPYGHFGDGCLHIRIDWPIGLIDRPPGAPEAEHETGHGSGPVAFTTFLHEAAALAARHSGSVSGEHGDGRARSELLRHMYSPEALALFARVKAAFDPDGLLNPGVIVDPDPAGGAIRVAAAPRMRRAELPSLRLALRQDRGDLSMAVHRCTGIGKCLADNTARGGVMCPSYLATRAEKDSTRARARVLQDVVAGHLDWRDDAVGEVLDLCLACKGCASDCPTGVDLAAYKAQALHERYRGRPRPRSHYALGWLPDLTRAVARVPGASALLNRMLSVEPTRTAALRSAGVDPRRDMPRFAERTLRSWLTKRPAPQGPSPLGEVALFVDTFTDAFAPEVGQAATEVLERAGYRVVVTAEPVCCGLTWVSTGQLDVAARRARDTIRVLWPYAARGVPIVGLEPSCTAAIRSDVIELMDDEPAVAAAELVASHTQTLAELLTATPSFEPPDLSGTTVLAQPHCHQHAVMGYGTDTALLRRAGAEVTAVGGCCGLAGNFGVEEGHYDVSVAVADLALLPAVDALPPDGVVLADGFSCRTQLGSLRDRRSYHLAEVLARRSC